MEKKELVGKEPMPMIGVVYALSSALLFGAITPLSKVLLCEIHPLLLAGLFYLGSGLGLTVFCIIRAYRTKSNKKELSFARVDLCWLAGAIVTGGMLAPVLLLFALQSAQASTTSLFLNLESIFTALVAWFVFKENFDKKLVLGMFSIFAGGVLLSLDSSGKMLGLSSLLISLACLAWAIDNNCTSMISANDAVVIACCKGLCAGIVNTILALIVGAVLPSPAVLMQALLIGFIGIGISLALFVTALRYIGAARAGAYFAFAPFFGAAFSILLLHEQFGILFILSAAFMALGLYLHLSEKHGHEHLHEELNHKHWHIHDEHHQHEHADGAHPHLDGKGGHVHFHEHAALMHSHTHFPDLHHRHDHN